MNLLAPPSLPLPGARREVPTYTLFGDAKRDALVLAEAFGDAYAAARVLARDEPGFIGYGVVEKRDGDGALSQVSIFRNRITTAGDEYYARRGVSGINSNGIASPTAASGMKLGTGSTSALKSGAQAALITYINASNNLFDSTFPTVAAVGGDAGWNATYKTSWAAGDVINANINEVVITNDAGTDATSTATNTYARAVIALVNKTASDSLAITWTHTFLGA